MVVAFDRLLFYVSSLIRRVSLLVYSFIYFPVHLFRFLSSFFINRIRLSRSYCSFRFVVFCSVIFVVILPSILHLHRQSLLLLFPACFPCAVIPQYHLARSVSHLRYVMMELSR